MNEGRHERPGQRIFWQLYFASNKSRCSLSGADYGKYQIEENLVWNLFSYIFQSYEIN